VRPASILPALLLACLACIGDSAYSEDTAFIGPAGDGRESKWSGEILDYTGRELRMRLSTGAERSFPAARVVRVNTAWPNGQLAGDELFSKHDYRKALEQYRAALGADTRDWVRRRIRAQVVWCFKLLGQWEQAGDHFLLLVGADPDTESFDSIPLSWTTGEPSAALARKAKGWMDRGDSAPAMLIGASHLLATGQRPAALDRLRRLATERDPRIAWLAETQLWRTQAFNASENQLDVWRASLEKMPEPLRAGPYYMLGIAAVEKQPEPAAVDLLRLPILYPRERLLSASALLSAGRAVERGRQPSAASMLYRELTSEFVDLPEAAEAQRRLVATESP